MLSWLVDCLVSDSILCLFANHSIQPTPEQDSGIHIPSLASNTGSLPDLSGLQFTPPTPDDSVAADQTYHHIGPMRSSVSQGSPGSRSRRARSGPKPLVLSSASHVQYQVVTVLLSENCPAVLWLLRG